MAPPFAIDPAGFPMVWVEAIAAWMQWLPLSRLELERYLSAARDRRIDQAWYGRLLAMNLAVAPSRIDSGSYVEALLTRIVPAEAERFAAGLGEGFALPTVEQWRRAWSALTALPAERGLPAVFARLGLEEPVRELLARIESAHLSFVATTRPRRQRTLADQMLMRYGVFEWAWRSEPPGRWVGIGEPRPVLGVALGSPDRGPAVPDRPETFRSYLYGCRLIRRR